MAETLFIDGKEHVLGRLASYAAKSALLGNKIVILNCEKIVKTGKRNVIVDIFAERIHNIGSRDKGPFWPRRPDTIVRRAIKRMIPYKKARGVEALHNIEVYMGIPKEYSEAKMISIDQAKLKESELRYITIGDLSTRLGSKGWQ